MLWNRVQNYSNFIVGGEVMFSGQDPWYHYRSTMYVVRHWPATMPFDPWTYFPYGTRSGQFGTLFDQVFGTIAIIVGLGSPSDQTVAMVALFAPAVVATLAVFPTYVIGRRLAGRLGGVMAIAILALSSGLFLSRSMVGVYDHQVAESLLQVTSVLAVMVALSVAERDKPVYEQFLDRDVPALRETVGYSMLAGLSMSLYLWTWPPAVLLIGIVGTFLLLWLNIEVLRGKSPEHTAIVGTVSMGTVAVLQLAVVQSLGISATGHTLLQVALPLLVAAGSAFMAWLARYIEANDYDRTLYPATIGAILATAAILAAILTPGLFSYIVNQVLRVVGFTASPSATAATVGEAQPLSDPDVLFDYYGLSVYVAIVAAVMVLFKHATDREASAETFLVVVWWAFMMAATFTQVRFMIYLPFPVAALTVLAVGYLISWVDFSFDDGVEIYEVLTIGAVVLGLFGTMVLVAPATAAGGSAAPPPEAAAWSESLDWLEGNSPAEGAYGEGGNGTLEYYGTYANREDFDYSSGAYGVISWWDYGHLITVQGKRIPNANPFQQGADQAANFLIAPNETQANDVLEGVDEDDAKTRYVAVDWKMANTYGGTGGKFFAPTQFYTEGNVSRGDYYQQVRSRQNPQQYFNYRTQDYYDSMVVRLYQYHGSAKEPQPYVVDWERVQTRSGVQLKAAPQSSRAIKQFPSMAAARNYTENDATSQVGGFGAQPGERVAALEHYRYVGSSERSAYTSSRYTQQQLIEAAFAGIPTGTAGQSGTCVDNTTAMSLGNQTYCMPDGAADTLSPNEPTWTKIFERVDGGTIEGTAPANATITAAVPMENQITGETFTYRQRTQADANGTFEMTVPYSTTGYESWGTDEGYTNVSVRAQGPYEFSTPISSQASVPFNGTANVTEGQVIGENETATSVDLELDLNTNQSTQNDTATNETATNETATNETATNSTAQTSGDSSTDTSSSDGTTNDSTASLARPAAEPAT